jgi:hypothetical protein
MDLIPERKAKRSSKYAESIDEIPCHEDTCAYEDEPESGNVSKAASMMIPPPSVLIQGCTPPSEEELYLNTDLFPESHSSEYSSLIDMPVQESQSERHRPTSLDEVDITTCYSPNAMHTAGSPCDEIVSEVEETNIPGDKPIKSTSNHSVSQYSITTHDNDNDLTNSPLTTTFVGTSIFTFTKPIESPTNISRLNSSSKSDIGIVIKSPPISASLIGEDTYSPHAHHIHHLHHQPLLPHYCISPSQPVTKDVTVELSPNSNSSISGVNSVISTTSPGSNPGKDFIAYFPSSNSNRLPTGQGDIPSTEGQMANQMEQVISADLLRTSSKPGDRKESKSTSNISFMKDNP